MRDLTAWMIQVKLSVLIVFFLYFYGDHRDLHSFPTRRSSDPRSTLQRAVAAGATEVHPVSDEHRWLLGRVADPFGHHWEIGKPRVEWPPHPAAEAGRDHRSEQA